MAATTTRREWIRRALGHDRPREFALVVAAFGSYAVIERLTGELVVVELPDLGRFSLVLSSLGHRWWLVVPVVVLIGAAALRQRARVVAPWGVLQHGGALRWFSASLVLMLTWQGALYNYNWFAGRVHLLDRLLVVVLGIAVLFRPMYLVAFAVVVRIVDEQFLLPFGTSAGRNIDQLLVLGLLAVAAVHVVFVITGSTRTSSVLLLVTTALAAHFFIPGKGKLGMGWLTSGDPANLPLSSYTTGWLGHTDGGWAERLADFYERFGAPVKVGTLVIELGSIVAVLHPRLTRVWLPSLIGFHTLIFATTGFWFGPWVVLEIGLILILFRRPFRDWVDENATPARGALAALSVLAAPVLFHPPGLAWLDAPVSYGYQIEAVGISGAPYHVPLSAFAPLDHHLAFDRVQFTSTLPASGAYGAVTSTFEFDALSAINDFEQLATYEKQLAPATGTTATKEFIQTFLERTAERPDLDWSIIAVPGHFWTGRPAPNYDFQEPLASLDVYLVRAIHHDNRPTRQRELVLHASISDPGG